MKTIVLFFVLFAFAAVSASHSKKHKAQESQDAADDSTHDWPQPQSVAEYGVPEDYSAAGSGEPSLPSPGQTPGDNGDSSGKHMKSNRRHHN